VTQDLCPVCAVSPSDFAGHMEDAGCRAEVVCLDPKRVIDVLDDIRRIGEATGRPEEAERLNGGIKARMEQVSNATGEAQERPRVLCLEWLEPPMPAGHWVVEMIRQAGGDDCGLVRPGEPSRKVPWEEMRRIEPEVVVLMPCGFGPERAAFEAGVLWQLEGWQRLAAVRKGRVYAVNGNAYFSRPGPRVVDGMEILASIFHPGLFQKAPPAGSVLKLVSAPAGASSVENWEPRFEPVLVAT